MTSQGQLDPLDAKGEAGRGHIGIRPEEPQQAIIAATSTQLLGRTEAISVDFEDHPGVIREATPQTEIDGNGCGRHTVVAKLCTDRFQPAQRLLVELVVGEHLTDTVEGLGGTAAHGA